MPPSTIRGLPLIGARKWYPNGPPLTAKAKEQLERKRKTVSETKADRDEVMKQRSELGYDVAIHTIFKNANRLAFELDQAREQAAQFDPEIIHSSIEAAEAAMQEALQVSNRAQENYTLAGEKWKAAQAAYETAQDQHKAAALRSGLSSGCLCPVCEQPVKKIPVTTAPADLGRAKAGLAAAESTKDAAAKKAGTAREEFTRAQSNADNARKNAAAMQEQAARYQNKVNSFTRSLALAIKPFECPAEVLLDQFVHQELNRLETLHSEWQRLGEKLSHDELKFQKAESDLEAANKLVETEEETRLRLSGEIAEAQLKLSKYDNQILAVSSDDPAKELTSIQEEIGEIEEQHKDAMEHHRKAADAAHETELKASETKASLASSATERDESSGKAEKALKDLRFENEDEARRARMDPKVIAVRDAEIDAFDRSVGQTAARIEELDELLEGVTLTEEEVKQQNRKAKDADEAVNDFGIESGRRTQELQRLRVDTEKAELLRADYAKRRSRHGLVQQLSQDLKSGFPQYLLDGTFRRLVAGASTRLRELNDRYELNFTEGKFVVVDHDHGSLNRLADTLSGGETFLVSLALALELSEQVQQAAGAVRLDSLFIDEGFGTLDPETLETVADAIEALSKTNRMVGIITHVQELHRRLPRLEVRPTASGSVVQYVED